MQVQVRLLLQGGHVWQFRCADDDPLIFGLISALPGASLAETLPSDGLIQVETGAGERLFLTRSSLVSLELKAVTDRAVPELAVRSGASKAAALPAGASSPAPFALVPNALSTDLHTALLEDAIAQGQTAVDAPQRNGRHALDLDRVPGVRRAIESWVASVRGSLGIPELLETRLELEFSALEGRASVPFDDRGEDALTLVYACRRSGRITGGIRLFDSRMDNGLRRAGPGFRDIEVAENTLLIFPGDTVCAGLPTQGNAGTFADNLFVVSGALRRGKLDG